MARKKHSTMILGYTEIRSIPGEKCELTIHGWNSKGTQVAIKISMDDSDMPNMAADFKKIVDKRVNDAHALKKRLLNSFAESAF